MAAQLEHREQIVGRRAHVRQGTDFFGDHAQLLKVDQAVNPGVVAQMDKRQILLDDGEERNLPEGKKVDKSSDNKGEANTENEP